MSLPGGTRDESRGAQDRRAQTRPPLRLGLAIAIAAAILLAAALGALAWALRSEQGTASLLRLAAS